MALFKVSKGKVENLSKQAITEGYAWFTPDDGKFYIDAHVTENGSEVLKRVPLNALKADQDSRGYDIQDTYSVFYCNASYTVADTAMPSKASDLDTVDVITTTANFDYTFQELFDKIAAGTNVRCIAYNTAKSNVQVFDLIYSNTDKIVFGGMTALAPTAEKDSLLYYTYLSFGKDGTKTAVLRFLFPATDLPYIKRDNGVGTGTTKLQKLKVEEDITIADTLAVDGNSITATSGLTVDSDTIYLGTDSTTKVGIGTSDLSTSKSILTVGGSASISNDLSVDNAVTVGSTVTATAAPTEDGHLTNKKYVDTEVDDLTTDLVKGTIDLPYIVRKDGEGTGTTKLETVKLTGTTGISSDNTLILDTTVNSDKTQNPVIIGKSTTIKVGIGTENPDKTLTVSGSASISNGLTVSDNDITVENGQVNQAALPEKDEHLANKKYVDQQDTILQTGLEDGTIDLPYVKRVNGAGTGVHSFQGVKIGPIASTDNKIGTNAGNAVLNVKSVSTTLTSGDYISAFVSGTSNKKRYLVLNADDNGSGNVGIGQITPTKKLDVTGDARISKDLTVGTTLTVENEITVNNGQVKQAIPPQADEDLANKKYVDQSFRVNDALLFKGVINSNDDIPTGTEGYDAGWVYKVGIAGTYVGQYCVPGDTIYCTTDSYTDVAIIADNTNSISFPRTFDDISGLVIQKVSKDGKTITTLTLNTEYSITSDKTGIVLTTAPDIGESIRITESSGRINSHWQILEQNNENIVVRPSGAEYANKGVGTETIPVYISDTGVATACSEDFEDYLKLTTNNTYPKLKEGVNTNTDLQITLRNGGNLGWDKLDDNLGGSYVLTFKDNNPINGITKTPFSTKTNIPVTSADDALVQGFYYIGGTGSERPSFKQVDNATANDYRVLTTAYSDDWLQQIATDFRSNDIFIRRKQQGTWQNWTPILKMQQGAEPCPIPDKNDNSINYIPRFDQSRNATLVPSNLKIKSTADGDIITGARVDTADITNDTIITKGYADEIYLKQSGGTVTGTLIVNNTVTSQISAGTVGGTTYNKWIKVCSLNLDVSTNYLPATNTVFTISRGYNSPAPESYLIALNTGWGNAVLTQVNGKAKTQIIQKARVIRDTTNHKVYFEIYIDPIQNTLENSCKISYINTEGKPWNSVWTVQTEADSSFEILNTLDLNSDGIATAGSATIAKTVTTGNSINITGTISNSETTITTSTTNPQLVFSETNNTLEKVGLIYTTADTYRDNKGLKLMDMGGTNSDNVWFEVQNHIYADGGHRVPTTGEVLGTVGTITKPVYVSEGVIKEITSYEGNAATATLAASATNATNDSDGNPINTTYLKKVDFITSDTKNTAGSTNLTSTKLYVIGATTQDTNPVTYSNSSVYISSNNVLMGAAWNDFAEFRRSEIQEPGRVLCETGLGDLILATERLQPGAEVISDTFGFAIGETEFCKTPVAVAGRVLAFPYEDIDTYNAGDAVCAAPGGTVSRMTREEIKEYPERIIGTVSEIPTYKYWNETEVKGRIWIKI